MHPDDCYLVLLPLPPLDPQAFYGIEPFLLEPLSLHRILSSHVCSEATYFCLVRPLLGTDVDYIGDCEGISAVEGENGL